MGYARLTGRLISDPNKANLKSVTESAQNGFVLFTNQEGELVGGPTEDQILELGTEKATIVDRAIEYAKESKGQVRIVIHRDEDSFRKVANVKGGAYQSISGAERQGMQDEVHIVLDDNTTELEVSQQLLHEMGHFKFRDLVNDAEERELLAAIENLAKTEKGVANQSSLYANYRGMMSPWRKRSSTTTCSWRLVTSISKMKLPESWVVLKTSLDSQSGD